MFPERDQLEEELRHNLAEREEELKALWQRLDGPFTYEDAIYRFYHQSYKIFPVQRKTLEIVEALKNLVPGRDFHPWFSQILERGTGKPLCFEPAPQWLEVAQPIVEAFFHARFFLDMACRHAKERQGQPYSSGFAALLQLFRLW